MTGVELAGLGGITVGVRILVSALKQAGLPKRFAPAHRGDARSDCRERRRKHYRRGLVRGFSAGHTGRRRCRRPV